MTSDDDSGGNARFMFRANLQAGTTYILVITTFSAGASGSISVSVSGPTRVTLTRLNVGSASTPTAPSTSNSIFLSTDLSSLSSGAASSPHAR